MLRLGTPRFPPTLMVRWAKEEGATAVQVELPFLGAGAARARRRPGWRQGRQVVQGSTP